MPIAGFGGEYNVALFKTWNFFQPFYAVFYSYTDRTPRNRRLRTKFPHSFLSCSINMQHATMFRSFFLFKKVRVSSKYCIVIMVIYSYNFFIVCRNPRHQSSSNFCEKLFPNFLSFVHLICSSLVLYVEMATSLPVKSWCEYFALIQHSL